MTQDNFDAPGDPGPPGDGLAEAQIAAIEDAFAEYNRMLARLRREFEELRARPSLEASQGQHESGLEDRVSAIETRLDQQDQALRHILQRLIGFFEREGPNQL